MLENIRDFLLSTREARASKPEELLNEATLHTYFYSQFFKSHGMKFKGGSKLIDRVQALPAGSFGFYNPNQEFAPRQRQTLRALEVPWAFSYVHYVLTDETSELNEGDDEKLVDFVMEQERSCHVDAANGIETALWALPNVETMENVGQEDAREAYSIPAFITRDGLAPSSTNGGVAAGTADWTTVQQLNVAQNPWYQNQYSNYSAAAPDDPDDGLVGAFDDIVDDIQFEMPDGVKSYATDDNLQNHVIATSRDGKSFYKARLRQLNDRMDRLVDPKISGPQYEGIPIKRVSQLDEAGWTEGQPDYFFINMKYLVPWFHPKRFGQEKVETGGAKQPNATVVYKFYWYNLFRRSARRQGRVSAAA